MLAFGPWYCCTKCGGNGSVSGRTLMNDRGECWPPEATQLGYGGVSLVSQACGLSRVTIMKGIQELDEPALAPERIRRAGGGRYALIRHDPRLPALLESLVEPLTRGDPESPLRWTCKSTRTLADELAGRQHRISHEKVAQLLRQMNYSLQSNRKTEEGDEHPDRDAQFGTSTDRCNWHCGKVSRSFRWIPRRRNWLGTLKAKGGSGVAKRVPKRFRFTIFPPVGAARLPLRHLRFGQKHGFCQCGNRSRHRPALLWLRSGVGGATKAGACIRKPRACSLRPTAGAATATACVFGNGSCSDWPTRRAWKLRSVTFRPDQQMEQGRTPPVLVHFFQLAWRTVARLRDGRWLDCLHHHRQRIEGELPAGPPPLPAGKEITPEQMASIHLKPGAISRGMELCHLSH